MTFPTLRNLPFLICLVASFAPGAEWALRTVRAGEGQAVQIDVRAGQGRAELVTAREGARVLATGMTGLTGEATLTLRGLAPGEHLISVRTAAERGSQSTARTITVDGEPLPEATPTDFWLAQNGDSLRRHATVRDGRLAVEGQEVSAAGVTAAMTADWDVDGQADLLFVAAGRMWLARGLAEGGFDAATALTAEGTLSGPVSQLLAGDWNFDGASDLLVGGEDSILYLAGRGDGLLTVAFRQTGLRLAPGRAEADWNGDGLGDVFVWRGAEGNVWVSDGAGGFAPVRVEAEVVAARAPKATAARGAAVAAAVGSERASSVWGNTTSGTIITIAGTGSDGFLGDGGAATGARVSSPEGLALDSAGFVYIADTENSRIRRISPVTKVIQTIAGTGVFGSNGDGGLAVAAQISQPRGIASDAAGNVYFADFAAGRVRRIDAQTKIITTVAGNGSFSSGGDGGLATAAQISFPYGVALDTLGNLYISEVGANKIRRVNATTGVITTVAGIGIAGYSGDNGPATSALINGPQGIAVDASGAIFFADSGNRRIRRVDPVTGVIATVAGNGLPGAGADGVGATTTSMDGVVGVALDGAGSLYYVEASGSRVRRVVGGVVRTIAGTGVQSFSGDNGLATSATMNSPGGLAVDVLGNVYISDTNNQRIRFVDLGSPSISFAAPGVWVSDAAGSASMGLTATPESATWTVTRDANWLALTSTSGVGSGSVGFAYNQNPSLLSRTATVTVNNQYSFLVTQAGAPAYLSSSKAMVSAAAGTGLLGLTVPAGVSWSVDMQGSWLAVSPLSGTGPATITYGYSANGGTAARMGLLTIAGRRFALLQVGTTGDYSQFGKVAPGTIQTVAGAGPLGYSGDGGAAIAAEIQGSPNLAVDGQGNLYFPSTLGRIRRIDAATRVISTYAGIGVQGFSGDGGLALQASFNQITAMAFDGKGNLYVSDQGNERIRKIAAGTTLVSTIAGTGNRSSNGDGGLATLADVNNVTRLAVDGLGNVYLGELAGRRIRQIHAETGIIRTVAGTGVAGTGGDGGLAVQARFQNDQSIAADEAGDLYIGDGYLRKLTVASGIINKVGGAGQGQSTGDGGPVSAADFAALGQVAIPPSGELLLGDGARVRRVATNGVIETVAGVGGLGGYSGDGGAAALAEIYDRGLAVTDGFGNLYLGQQLSPSERIRFVSLYGPEVTLSTTSASVTPLAGSGSVSITVTPAGAGWGAVSKASWLTVTASGQGGSVDYSFTANNGVPRSGTITIGGKDFTVVQGSGTLPVIVSGTPVNPVTTPQVLTVVARDPDGYSNINRVFFVVGPVATSNAGTCSGFYDRASNGVYLYTDAGTGLSGPLTPGFGLLQNSQCTLIGSGTSVPAAGGTDLTLNLQLNLLGAWATSPQKIWFSLRDNEGNDSGWTQTGTWGTPAGASAPTITSVQPASPVGLNQTFNIVANDGNGYADIQRMELLISTSSTVLNGACRVYFNRAANTFYLYDNAGTVPIGPLTGGGTATLENSQCQLRGNFFLSETHSGTSQGMSVPLALDAGFGAVARNIYVRAVDAEGNDTGWILSGSWAGTNAAEQPSVVSASVTPVVGNPVTLRVTARDPNGYADLQRIYFLLKTSANGNATPTTTAGSCHGYYDRAQNAFFLYNAALTALTGPLTPGANATLANGVCTLEGLGSVPVTGLGSDMGVPMRFSLPSPAQGFGTGYAAWVYVVDSKGNGTGWVDVGSFAVPQQASTAPVLVSATPATPSGSPQTFSIVARDAEGAANVKRVYFLVNPNSGIPQNTCHGYFDVTANAFYLYNDALSSLTGPLTPGGAGTLQNGQCSINGPASAPVASAGTDLTLSMAMSLTGSYGATAKNIYFWIVDAENNGTGWVQAGTWAPGSLNQPPTVVLGTPTAPIGSPQTFRFVARDPNGFANVERVYFLVNPNASVPANTCHGFYDRRLNAFYLYNDALSGLLGPLAPGAAGVLQNGQCTVDGATSAPPAGSGTDLSMNLGLSLSAGYGTGTKNVYVWVTDTEANGTGWVSIASWTGGPAAQAPVLVSASPSTATGASQVFTLVARDGNGVGDLQRVYFQVHTSATVPVNTCHGLYDRALNAFYLYNDGLTALLGPLTPGAAGTLQNGQCTLDGPTSAPVTGLGTDLTLRLGLRLNGQYGAGTKNLYAWVTDNEGNGTGWVQAATWTGGVNVQAPVLLSASPSTGSGATILLSAVARDVDGAANLQRIYFVVNTNPSVPANSCHGFYDRALNAFYMYNDALTALMGPLAPEGSGALVNGQCSLLGTGTTAKASGTDLAISLLLIVNGNFGTGQKNVYLWVTDNDGNGTGWVQASTWTFATVAQAPSLAAVTPTAMSGPNQLVSYTVRDANGFSDVDRLYFVVNTSPTVSVAGCHGFYDRRQNAYFLYDDTLGGLTGPVVPGGIGVAQNSQCAINGAGSTGLTGSGTDALGRLSLSLRGGFASGNKNLYFWVTDTGGLGTGWVQGATWALP